MAVLLKFETIRLRSAVKWNFRELDFLEGQQQGAGPCLLPFEN